MLKDMIELWLQWVRRLEAIAQTGLFYAADPYDRERYEQLRAIAAEMVAHHAGAPFEQVLKLLSADDGYATPKVDVRGVVFHDDKLLYVREREDGQWTLPGGWADVGQSPAESVVREVREESGYEVKALKLLAFYDRDKHPHPPILHHSFKVFFRCELLGGSPQTSYETTEVGFFGEHEIPDLSLPRVLPEQIRHMFQHYRNPAWPATFE
jgi:ADP-ribose pyrophosphatase YjhB (NUDIX family)